MTKQFSRYYVPGTTTVIVYFTTIRGTVYGIACAPIAWLDNPSSPMYASDETLRKLPVSAWRKLNTATMTFLS
jgi:hypothetical protein